MFSKIVSSFIAFLILVVFVASPAFAGITIDQITFHKAYRITSGGPEGEGGETDNGGAMFVYIRNTGSDYQAFYNHQFNINGQSVTSMPGYKWYRVWPIGINPGETTCLVIKGISAPMAENQNVTMEMWTDQGAYANMNTTLTTPLLRVGHVVPSQDFKTLYIFLRNTDSASFTINNVYVNNDVTSQCTFVGGTVVAGNDIKIIKVQYSDEWTLFPILKPLSIRIKATRNTGTVIWTGSFLRLTEPTFQLGTWSGDMFTSDDRLIEARKFRHTMVGPDFRDAANRYANAYNVFSWTLFDNVPSANPQQVIDKRYKPGIAGWFMDDEPELSANHTSNQVWNAAMAVWFNGDLNSATMVNNARNKVFQQYGLTVDHPCYDHYCQFAPLCYGGFGTTYSIKNAFRYADSLKQNCEPLRIWSYSQGISTSSGWRGQPTTWGIKVQFWSEIMGGVKGIKWFLCQNESGYTNQYNSIRQCLKELNQVQDIVLYGDVVDRVTESSGNMISTMIVGENAVVVPVVNASGTYTNGITASVSMSNLSNQSITINVPSNIPIQQVKRVTESGLVSQGYSQNGQTITISGLSLTDTNPHYVFLIGANDTTAPDEPLELNLACWKSGKPVLSWKEPHDNYGILGYRVYRDGGQIADIQVPVYQDNGFTTSQSTYTVKAYDAAGNVSGASTAFNMDHPTWIFNDARNFQGWGEIYNIHCKKVLNPSGPLLYWTLPGSSGTQPSFYSPGMAVNSPAHTNIKIDYYNGTSGTTGVVYWTNDGVNFNYSTSFTMTQNQWSTATLNMTGLNGWTGTIYRLLIVMPAGLTQQDWQYVYLSGVSIY